MLNVVQEGILSRSFRFERDGEVVGTLRLRGFGHRADIVSTGETLEASRKGIFRLRFGLERAGEVLASAEQPSLWRLSIDLHLGRHRCQMMRRGLLARTFELLDDVDHIGRIVRTGWFTKKATVELPDEWPLPLQMFTYWITLVIWKRMDAASSSGS